MARRKAVCSAMFQPRPRHSTIEPSPVAGIETFDLGRHIDETIRLDHGCQNAGPLIPGRSHLEHTVFPA